MEPDTARAILWCIPRSVSTALMKSMGRVPDVEIWHEPFSFSYWAAQCLRHFSGQDLPLEYDDGHDALFQIAAQQLSAVYSSTFLKERLCYGNVLKGLEESKSKYVFVKDMSISMADDHRKLYIPKGFRHSFLIRHPVLTYSSMKAADYRTCRESGKLLLHDGETDEKSFDLRKHSEFVDPADYYKSHYALWKYVRENIDPNVVVVDSSDLLANPAAVLPKYCEAVGFPYSDSLLDLKVTAEAMLRWKCAADDRVLNNNYIGVATASSRFHSPKNPLPRDQLPDDVIELSDIAMPYYH